MPSSPPRHIVAIYASFISHWVCGEENYRSILEHEGVGIQKECKLYHSTESSHCIHLLTLNNEVRTGPNLEGVSGLDWNTTICEGVCFKVNEIEGLKLIWSVYSNSNSSEVRIAEYPKQSSKAPSAAG
jgi:hypothetical protein